ncbi:MAG: 4Fe-4S binding protein [Candidatus Cloacimonadales bacterium]
MKRKIYYILLLILLIVISCKSISELSYEIDEAACTACGECVNACPHNAIVYDGDKPVIIQSKCVSCGECVSACPESAIK